MKSTLYFLTYNNYNDRVSKRELTIGDYLDYEEFQLDNYNFVPGDGVDTVLTAVTWEMDKYPVDYVVVAENGEISSRWFIMDAQRQLSGVWNVTLHRDVITDYRDKIMEMPMMVKSGIVDEADNTIFNNEGGTYNQIKTGETLLKDKSECQWIVGYYARKTGEDDTYTNLEGTGEAYTITGNYDTYTSLSAYPYYQYRQIANPFVGFPTIKFVSNVLYPSLTRKKVTLVYNGGWAVQSSSASGQTVFTQASDEKIRQLPDKAQNRQTDILNAVKSVTGYHTLEEERALQAQDGYVFKTSDTGKYYKVSITSQYQTSTAYKTGTSGTLHDQYAGVYTDAGMAVSGSSQDFDYTVEATKYVLSIAELNATSVPYNYNIPATRNFTYDAPYDVFAIPYSDTFKFTSGSTTITASKEIAMAVASGISSKYSGVGTVYDIQLLPYCPFNITGTTYTSTDTKEFSYITQGSNKVGVIFNVSSINRPSFTIPLTIAVNDVKVDNETKFCRLVSPNYASMFEFSPAKNRGVDYIKIDMTLKPFTPYIHLAPNFKGLNGGDYNDARGLICSGDFSLPVITDQWKTYELQNKNYEKQFNRQIQNMEVNNNIAREEGIWNTVAGTLQGAGSGALIGNTFGPIGAGVGAGVGAVASLAAGIRGIGLDEERRQETVRFARENFKMQMQNIKALPNTLTKVDSFNIQNKGWPFVEFYDCTEEEKRNLCNKILYSGMTINRFGKLSDYTGTWSYPSQAGGDEKWAVVYFPYISGELILSSGIDMNSGWNLREDRHTINTIAAEISKGVYYV